VIPEAPSDPRELCRALEFHLRDSGRFEYSLTESVVDPRIDPVLDFLVNRRSGHCEYYASALALLLRSMDVPTRVINGFKGGDWSELFGKVLVVRQRHAHSWVEAMVPMPQGVRWITLDPTPGQARQRFVAGLTRTPSLLRQFADISRDVWWSYVLNYNASEQEQAVYGPLRRLAVQGPMALARYVRRVLTDESGSFNWPAAVLSSACMAVLVVLANLLIHWLSRIERARGRDGTAAPAPGARGWLRRLLERYARKHPALAHQVVFYDRLVQALEAHGIAKQPSWTPRFFAEQAALAIGRLPQGNDVATVPAELVDRFYHVRFGQHALGPGEIDRIDRQLQALEEALGAGQTTQNKPGE
jgi:hypothetical protein